jgi:hypothetical protein
MEDLELNLWNDLVDSLVEAIETKRLWKHECIECNMYDHIEGTGCFLDRCKLNGESTWIK